MKYVLILILLLKDTGKLEVVSKLNWIWYILIDPLKKFFMHQIFIVTIRVVRK